MISHLISFAQTIRRKRKVHVPMGRLGERETMSEHDEEEDSYDEEIYETRSGRSGAYSGVGGAMGRRSGRSSGRRDRERERSGSRERSLSPRSDRRSHNLPPRPAKVTLVKSRKNEGEAHKVGDKKKRRVLCFFNKLQSNKSPAILFPIITLEENKTSKSGLVNCQSICQPQQNPS